ncbi:MAG TPA: histidinol-phosphate transaminase [Opitutaceae bacterium]
MLSSPHLNRRDWLKSTGAVVASLAVASQFTSAKLRAQHEADRSARRAEPARISGNENPYGPSQMAIMAMMQALEGTYRYPGAETRKLIDLIAAKEGVKPENVVMGVGSGEILEVYGLWLGQQKGEVVTVSPGYSQMTRTMETLGSKIISVPLNDALEHDLDAMASKVGANTKCVYVCNPNNPTGTIVNAAKLKAFAIEVSKKAPVFIDEAYLECCDDFAGNTMVGLVAEGHNVAVARTFSKVYGLAGQRIGYGIMPAAMAEEVRKYSTGSLNLLGVVAATASLEDATYVEETRLKIKAERDKLCALLKELGRKYAEPNGNFVFFQTGMPIKTFQEKMLAENVQVGRPFPPLLDWCRISIGSPDEMTMAHAALKKVFAA